MKFCRLMDVGYGIDYIQERTYLGEILRATTCIYSFPGMKESILNCNGNISSFLIISG